MEKLIKRKISYTINKFTYTESIHYQHSNANNSIFIIACVNMRAQTHI